MHGVSYHVITSMYIMGYVNQGSTRLGLTLDEGMTVIRECALDMRKSDELDERAKEINGAGRAKGASEGASKMASEAAREEITEGPIEGAKGGGAEDAKGQEEASTAAEAEVAEPEAVLNSLSPPPLFPITHLPFTI